MFAEEVGLPIIVKAENKKIEIEIRCMANYLYKDQLG